MREMLATQKDILAQLQQMQQQSADHDDKIILIFEYIKKLEEAKQQDALDKVRKRIGFK